MGLGARIIVPIGLEAAGCLAAARGDDALAVRLWAAAARERTDSGFANMPADERHLDERMAQVRERLDPGTFADAWGEGSRARDGRGDRPGAPPGRQAPARGRPGVIAPRV